MQSTGLSQIYGKPKRGIEAKCKLWSGYKELADEGFYDFAVACGVLASIPVTEQSCYEHPLAQDLRQDYNQTGIRFTDSGIDRDYDIPILDELLKAKDIQINALLWKTMCKVAPEMLEAEFRPNRRYETRQDKSSVVLKLSKAAWIPNKKGVLHKPAQILKNDLHPEFKFDNRNGWLDEIGFGEEQKKTDEKYQKRKEHAKALGMPTSVVDKLDELPPDKRAEAWDAIKDMLVKRAAAEKKANRLKQKAMPFHEALANTFHAPGVREEQAEASATTASRNPVRRQGKLADEISAAIRNEPSLETRFTFGLCKKWKGKDDAVRVKLLEWYAGRCQICNRTFTQRNGQPYFEGLYLVPFTHADWIDRPGNVICLCPWHSAMFQFGVKEIDGDIVERISSFVPKGMGGSTEPALKIALCGEDAVLTFAEDHFLELQVMARESSTTSRSEA